MRVCRKHCEIYGPHDFQQFSSAIPSLSPGGCDLTGGGWNGGGGMIINPADEKRGFCLSRICFIMFLW